MESVLITLASIVALIVTVMGARYVHVGERSQWTLPLMIVVFALQLSELGIRGEARAACPLMDIGEICIFAAWSLTMFYLMVGSVYRLSLLGVFTAPLVLVLMLAALVPGALDADPQPVSDHQGATAIHSALSVLSYGAFGLAAVSAVMFLVLDKQLKGGHPSTGLFRNLPPIHSLTQSVARLLFLGLILLSVGVIFGFTAAYEGGISNHLWLATAVWIGYLVLLSVWQFRGMPPRTFSITAVFLFVFSLVIFPLL